MSSYASGDCQKKEVHVCIPIYRGHIIMKLEALSRACQEKKSIYKLCRIGPCMYSYKTYIGKGRWLGEWCRIIVRHGLRLWHGHCKMRPRELVNDFSSPNLICRNANRTYIGKGRWLGEWCKIIVRHGLRLWHGHCKMRPGELVNDLCSPNLICRNANKTYIGKGRWLGEWCKIIVRHGLRLWHGHCKMRPGELVNDLCSPNLICRNGNKTYIGKGRWRGEWCKIIVRHGLRLWHGHCKMKLHLKR